MIKELLSGKFCFVMQSISHIQSVDTWRLSKKEPAFAAACLSACETVSALSACKQRVAKMRSAVRHAVILHPVTRKLMP